MASGATRFRPDEPDSDGRLAWVAPLFACAAFLGGLAVFCWLLAQFWADVGFWARRDLKAQAELAAMSLAEPLATQNFRTLAEFHQSLESKGMLLRIRSAQGGWIFHGGYKGPTVEEAVPCGEYTVGVAIQESRVYAPFYEALWGFALAALVGVFGMSAVFFVLYRQRVRIRELARLERFRREFIADVSHEIRTPLTGILGAVDLLEADEAPASSATARLLAMIRHESKRLNALVQSILDLARLEREGETAQQTETDLADLVSAAVQRLLHEATSRGIRLSAQGIEHPFICVCDAQLIERAIDNLLGNALRHSGASDVFVSLAAHGNGIRLAVEDNGCGIPPKHAAHIFERFHRIDPSRAAATGGAGLGLAIVRRIARLHGGEVTLENVHPHGARFILALPLAH